MKKFNFLFKELNHWDETYLTTDTFYAFPKDILRQLKFYDIHSNESKELIEILKEQIELINTPEIHWEEYDKHTNTEIRKSFGIKYNVPKQKILYLKVDDMFNHLHFNELISQIEARYRNITFQQQSLNI